jgi:deoxyribodipyrimidine photolyase-related protein
LATKPYVSSANYINKMSNYCKWCKYNHKEKYGDDACPFNSLYWKFVDTHQELFKKRGQGFLLSHLKKIDRELLDETVKEFKEL